MLTEESVSMDGAIQSCYSCCQRIAEFRDSPPICLTQLHILLSNRPASVRLVVNERRDGKHMCSVPLLHPAFHAPHPRWRQKISVGLELRADMPAPRLAVPVNRTR
eukprot:1597612-Pyramimonas_sp.AAC.1